MAGGSRETAGGLPDGSWETASALPSGRVRRRNRYHSTYIPLQNINKYFYIFGVNRSRVTTRGWMHRAELQPTSTVTGAQTAADGETSRGHGEEHWLDGTVDPKTNDVSHVSALQATAKQPER